MEVGSDRYTFLQNVSILKWWTFVTVSPSLYWFPRYFQEDIEKISDKFETNLELAPWKSILKSSYGRPSC